jgi:hypothetical protein
VANGTPINVPVNYYPDDDPSRPPLNRWRSHASSLWQLDQRDLPVHALRPGRDRPLTRLALRLQPNRHTGLAKPGDRHAATLRRRDQPLLPRRRAERVRKAIESAGKDDILTRVLSLPGRDQGQGLRRPDGAVADQNWPRCRPG